MIDIILIIFVLIYVMHTLLDEIKIKSYIDSSILRNSLLEISRKYNLPLSEKDGIFLIGDYVFGYEFRGKKFFYSLIEKMLFSNKEFHILITSSKVKAFKDLNELVWVIKKKFNSRSKWVIYDITNDKKIFINFNFKLKNKTTHRRKKIYGKKIKRQD